MKYKLVKNYNGNVEIIYGSTSLILTDIKPSVTLTSDEYLTIPKSKMDLIINGFILVEVIDEIKNEVIDEGIEEPKKFKK